MCGGDTVGCGALHCPLVKESPWQRAAGPYRTLRVLCKGAASRSSAPVGSVGHSLIVLPGINILNRIRMVKGLKGCGKTFVCYLYLIRGLCLNISTPPDNRVKSKSKCFDGFILNYEFTNLHNSLSASTGLFNVHSENWENRPEEGGKGRRGDGEQ